MNHGGVTPRRRRPRRARTTCTSKMMRPQPNEPTPPFGKGTSLILPKEDDRRYKDEVGVNDRDVHARVIPTLDS